MNNLIKIVGSFSDNLESPPQPCDCDVVEVRLDSLMDYDELIEFMKACELPILSTARDIAEGGIIDLSIRERETRLLGSLDYSSYVDIEMRNWNKMPDLINESQSRDISLVASYHDFDKTPSLCEIHELIDQYRNLGADILKFAFMTRSISDISICQEALFTNPGLQLSIMGMGAYAPASRLLLAQSGSVLNYGYLGNATTAPGQWPAALLKQAIEASETLS